ncbi:MAG: pimeloyl-ACP methyl ester carboxylesterase [Planctomycetota bacterium]|jgi:pimeloyl-ACP methyl ester carboxylesterase
MNISMLSGLAALGLATLPAISSTTLAEAVETPVSPAAITAAFSPGSASASASTSGQAPVSFQVVQIVTEDKLTLAGSWFAPRKKGQPVPGVVLVHDAGSDRSSMDGVADRLRKDGFAVVSVDLRGHGESASSDLDWSALDEGEQNAQWAFAQRDVNAAVNWLLAQNDVHSTRLTVVGHGAGCALAVRHMRDDENAIAVALIEPKAECFGFKVNRDLADLEGLPTYIVASREAGKQGTEAMVQEANSNSGDEPFVELWLTTPPILTSRKTASRVSGFLKEHALPKKGK